MRRTLPPVVEVHPVNGGFVVVHTANGRAEYLGSDRLWHRTPVHCDPFSERAAAELKAEAVRGGLA